MRNSSIASFAIGVSFSAIVLSTPAFAQSPQAESGNDQASLIVQDIVVTAERRSSTVQKTPIAITAVSGDNLLKRQITSIESLANNLPNVTFSRNGGDARVFIRGIGVDSIAPGSDPRVAIYTDGAYNPRVQAALGSFFDIDRVEVLSGPQGTLYGRNATAGAVNILTRDPGDTLNGYGKLTVGNYDEVRTEGAVGGPLSDTVGVRLAFQTGNHSGYGKNIVTGQEVDDLQTRAVRAKIKFQQGQVTATLVGDYFLENDHTGGYHFLGNTPGNVPFGVTLGASVPTSPRDYAGAGPTGRVESGGVTGSIDYDLGSLTLSSISAYKHLESSFLTGVEGSTLSGELIPLTTAERSDSFTQELRVGGKIGSLDVVVGAYYFYEKNFGGNHAGFNLSLFTGGAVNSLKRGLVIRGTQSTNAYALFTQNTFHVTNKIGIDFGARYSSENRRATTINALDLVTPYTPTAAFAPGFGDVSASGERGWSSFDPKVGIHFQATPDVLIYTSYSTGFKSGGFNLVAIQPPFNPEQITDIEGGIKADLFNRRLRINLSAFDYKYKNLQVNMVSGTQLLTTNAAKASLYGVEAQILARPFNDLELNFDAAYLHSKFDSYLTQDPSGIYTTQPLPDGTLPNANGEYQLAGHPLTNAPRWKLHASAAYTFHAGDVDVTPRAEATYTSQTEFSAFKLPYVAQPGYTLANFYIDFDLPKWGLSAGLFVKNATDKLYRVSATIGSGITGYPLQGLVGAPRTFGGSITKRF